VPHQLPQPAARRRRQPRLGQPAHPQQIGKIRRIPLVFTELESALLESDLDNEAVEAGLHRYLSGLEEIARLDIRAIYRERRSAGDVLHVVARTTTAPHKYFYRTWAHRAWTPWAPVAADIEGDHVVLVVWRGRVHLFWVQFMPQAEASTSGISSDKKVADFTAGQVAGIKPKKKMDVLLYWSCLFRGQWNDPVLAEPDDEPQTTTVSASFTPRGVFMWGDVLDDGSVSLSLLGQGVDQSFRIRSPYVPPEQSLDDYRVPLSPPYLTGSNERALTRVGQGRWRGEQPKFAVHVEGYTLTDQGITPCDITQDILAKVPTRYHLVIIPPPARKFTTDKSTGKTVLAANQPANRPEDPFFFLDRDHTFFVEPEWFESTIAQAHQAVVAQTPVWHDFDTAAYWQARELAPAFPVPADERLGPEVVLGTAPLERPVDVITRPEAVVTFAGRPVGPAGGLVAGAGGLVRTGPHGSLIRPDVGIEVRAGTDVNARLDPSARS
jgi:hypothetical protein